MSNCFALPVFDIKEMLYVSFEPTCRKEDTLVDLLYNVFFFAQRTATDRYHHGYTQLGAYATTPNLCVCVFDYAQLHLGIMKCV